jgi:hypothetical protein
MATIPEQQQFHTLTSSVVTADLGSTLANSGREVYTMQDITDTVSLSAGTVGGSGTTGFLPIWTSATGLGDSEIERTLSYGADGGQYELRGNLKIFGESSGAGVAALFIEDDLGARLEIRDVVSPGGAINSEFEIQASDIGISIGTTASSPVDQLLLGSLSAGQFRFSTVTDSGGTDIYCFAPATNLGKALGSPTPSGAWRRAFFNLPAYADDAAAVAGGSVSNELYQTDGTGAAPLNVAGIVMVTQ